MGLTAAWNSQYIDPTCVFVLSGKCPDVISTGRTCITAASYYVTLVGFVCGGQPCSKRRELLE